jgi:hypothetical protein
VERTNPAGAYQANSQRLGHYILHFSYSLARCLRPDHHHARRCPIWYTVALILLSMDWARPYVHRPRRQSGPGLARPDLSRRDSQSRCANPLRDDQDARRWPRWRHRRYQPQGEQDLRVRLEMGELPQLRRSGSPALGERPNPAIRRPSSSSASRRSAPSVRSRQAELNALTNGCSGVGNRGSPSQVGRCHPSQRRLPNAQMARLPVVACWLRQVYSSVP